MVFKVVCNKIWGWKIKQKATFNSLAGSLKNVNEHASLLKDQIDLSTVLQKQWEIIRHFKLEFELNKVIVWSG